MTATFEELSFKFIVLLDFTVQIHFVATGMSFMEGIKGFFFSLV